MAKKHKLLNILKPEDRKGEIRKKVGKGTRLTKFYIHECKGCKKELHLTRRFEARSNGYCRFCFTQITVDKNKRKMPEPKQEETFNSKGERFCFSCKVFYPKDKFLIKRKKTKCDKCYRLMIYNITAMDYNYLLLKQNEKCAICKNPETAKFKSGVIKSLVVDHCHETGKVRGLLCGKCNTGIGLLRDNEQFLWGAIMYLKKSKNG